MPLTEEQIGALTLAEVERIAARFGKAVADIREAHALLGAPVLAPASVSTHSLVPGTVTHVPPSRPPSRIDPEAQADLEAFRASAERNRIIAANRDDPSNFPPSIANAMRTT